jgi:hypothetical protein
VPKCLAAGLHLALFFSHLLDRDHFPPLFCSKKRTFFFTTGSYFSIERGREARGRTIVRKKPVMAILMRRTAIVRDFSVTGNASQFVVSTIKDEDGGRKMERRVADEATPSSGLDVRFFAIAEDMV